MFKWHMLFLKTKLKEVSIQVKQKLCPSKKAQIKENNIYIGFAKGYFLCVILVFF